MKVSRWLFPALFFCSPGFLLAEPGGYVVPGSFHILVVGK